MAPLTADAQRVVDRAIERAGQTWVFDHPERPGVVILSHPGQPAPNMDPKSLRENFGIMPEHIRHIKLLSASSERPLTEAEKAAEASGGLDAYIADLEEKLAAARAQKAVAEDDGHPAEAKSRSKSGVESSPPEE